VYSRDHPAAANVQTKVLKVKLKSTLSPITAMQAELCSCDANGLQSHD